MTDPAVPAPVLTWRVPPYQPAVLLLLVCAAAGLNIYGHPSATVRMVTLSLGILAFGFAVVALRMHLIADDDGVAVRRVRREAWLPWPTVADVELIDIRGASTVRVTRTDGTFVDVPPSLLQPGKPTSKRTAQAQVEHVVRQVKARQNSLR